MRASGTSLAERSVVTGSRGSTATLFHASGTGRRRFAYYGAAALVSVGYVDPGNWATDLEGGARFGYQLLWVLLGSGLIATLLQTLSAKLGVVTGLDLAAACRQQYPARLSVPLWVLAELGIIACDMAEVLGSAVALNLLFGLPLLAGALLTGLDVLLLLAVQRQHARGVEMVVTALVLVIAACLGTQLLWARPDLASIGQGLVPKLDSSSLYIAIGMLGATVMPHNLYLHSAIVPQREALDTAKQQRSVLRKCFSSTAVALTFALLLNAAILIVASAVFHSRQLEVTDLRDAHRLLAPLLGTSLASLLFAVALLCSGQSSTITGTLAGQVVMEGFVRWRLPLVLRRALTRGLAIVPAVIVLSIVGARGSMLLLIASQVVLSLQLPFAVVPLVRFTSSTAIMGRAVNSLTIKALALVCALLVCGANAALIARLVSSWRATSPLLAYGVGALAGVALLLLGWISIAPLRANRDGATPLGNLDEAPSSVF
jgi:manganese transport protein